MLVNGRRVELSALAEHVRKAIGKVALAFSSITEEDTAFLLHVDAADGGIKPWDEEVGRLARLLTPTCSSLTATAPGTRCTPLPGLHSGCHERGSARQDMATAGVARRYGRAG
jgi:hypothetical protein